MELTESATALTFVFTNLIAAAWAYFDALEFEDEIVKLGGRRWTPTTVVVIVGSFGLPPCLFI